MSRGKRALGALARPRPFCALGLTLLCSPALLFLFSRGLEESAAAFPVHALSAYTLFAWAVCIPGAVARCKAAVCTHRLGRRYWTDLPFRGRVSLLASTVTSASFALFKLWAGLRYRSFWFGALAAYYLLLAAIRAFLLRKSLTILGPKQEYLVFRTCGWLLFLLNIALSAVTAQMVVDGRGYHYPGYLIFAVALYAFYAITMAIVNLIRFRKLNNPVLSASKILGLATALVSMLSLQTAMLDAFGGGNPGQRTMNALTGGAVCLILLGLAVFMVVNAHRRIKRLV